MAQGPWRCSQCGTINEPVANSCRNCGKWPSLFDLEESVVDEGGYEGFSPREPEPEAETETYGSFEPRTVEVETFEQPGEASQPEPFEPEPVAPDAAEEQQRKQPKWLTWLVPIAFLGYLVISYAFSGR